MNVAEVGAPRPRFRSPNGAADRKGSATANGPSKIAAAIAIQALEKWAISAAAETYISKVANTRAVTNTKHNAISNSAAKLAGHLLTPARFDRLLRE